MSSTEEYLDSLLRSVMSGKKPPEPINQILNETPQEPENVPVTESLSEMETMQDTEQHSVDNLLDEIPVDLEPAPVYTETPSDFDTSLVYDDSTNEITDDIVDKGNHASFLGSIMSEISSEIESQLEKTSMEESQPIVEETPVFEETPIFEEPLPTFEETPVYEEPLPAYEEVPVFEENPVYEEPQPIAEEAPVFEETPIFEEPLPTFEETPVYEEPLPAFEEAPVFEETPVFEEPLPTSEETPVYEEPLPAFEEAPVFEETPVFEEPLPTFEETSVYEEPLPAFDEVPVFEETPVYEEPQPIAEEVPAFEETPVFEDTAANEESVADEDISNLLKSIEEMGTPVSDEGPSLDDMLDNMSDDSEPEGDNASLDFGFDESNLEATDDAPLMSEEADLSDLLSGMGGDSELSEIGDLLSMDDNNEAVDASVVEQALEEPAFDASSEDFFNFDEPISEDELEEDNTDDKKKKKERKKKGKKEKKVKKDKKEKNEDGSEDTEGEPKEKKSGFFGKVFDSLTKEVEEDEEAPKQVFEESAVDIAVETAAENEKILDEMGDEEAPEDKKGKKAKKEKKPKEKKPKIKVEKFPDDPGMYRKLPLKNVIVICILCFSLGIVITLLTYLYPYYKDTKKAQSAYDHGDYTETYTDLKGHNLNKKQQELYNKSVVILKEKRKLDSYEKYMQLNMPAQALDALLQGLRNSIDFAAMAEELDILDTFNQFKAAIEEKIVSTFGLDLDRAYNWCMIDDPQEYSKNIYDYINEKGMNNVNNTTAIDNSVISGEEEEFAE